MTAYLGLVQHFLTSAYLLLCKMLFMRLFGSVIENADKYGDLFDAEVKRVLEDIHAPLRTDRRRCGQYDGRALCRMKPVKPSSFIVDWNVGIAGSGLQSDKQAYLSACMAARHATAS